MTPSQITNLRGLLTKTSAGDWQGCLHLRSDADQTCGCGYRGGIWALDADVLVCEMATGRELGADMIPISDRATVLADAALIVAMKNSFEALLDTAERVERLVWGLRRYGRHDGLCGLVGGYDECTCGVDALLAETADGGGK